MSAPALPDFENTLQLAQGNLNTADLAECHGVLCGLVEAFESTVQQLTDEDMGFELWLPDDVEYVRIVTLMMCEDFRGPGTDDPIH